MLSDDRVDFLELKNFHVILQLLPVRNGPIEQFA